MSDLFTQVGICSIPTPKVKKAKWYKGKPLLSALLLAFILLGCLFCELFIPKDPTYMDLYRANVAPNREFWFGTDPMGRDIFSMIWYGGRFSLLIGLIATAISTAVAILFGTISGLAPRWLDRLLMRLADIILSIPSLLLVILIQSILGSANLLSISFVIGITSWITIAKVVRTQVRQIYRSEYIVAARSMGAGFFRILWKHLTPNFVSSIMYMVVMNIRGAIVAESTLSFMGIGLSLNVISWGSMLSLSEKALLSSSWWIILIPGIFLVTTMLCVTNIGNYLRKSVNQKQSNLP